MKHTRSKYINRLKKAVILIFIATCSFKAQAKEISLDELKNTSIPTVEYVQIKAIHAINQIIATEHFKRTQLDDERSISVLDTYLERLDPAKTYFLQRDIQEFYKYQRKFDDYIGTGNLRPIYAIFSVYRKRVEQQIKYALERIQQPFDFSLDEEILIDRSDADWAQTRDELNDLWRKRIKNDILLQRLAKKDSDKIIETLSKRYLHSARVARQMKSDDVFQIFVNAYASTIEPHTLYYTPQAVENFEIHMQLSLEGIGTVLQTDNEYTQIVRIIPGGPADLSNKLHPDDRIVGVAQDDEEMIDIIGWSIDDVAKIIRGKKETKVRLEILSGENGIDGDSEIISLVRDKIKLEEGAAKKHLLEIETASTKARIGVIELPSFYIDFRGRNDGVQDYKRTTPDVKILLEELKESNIDGLVIDLRNNGGGGLDEAIEMAGLFIPQGPIVQVEYTNNRVAVNYDNDPEVFYDGPLAVLVNRYSASASEIFSGAMQDYDRGIIIGEPTYGKGTVQSIVPLSRVNNSKLGNLKITVAQFFRVNGDSTQNRGVIPDVIWELGQDTTDFGEKSLDNAIEWSQLPTAEFSKYPIKIDGNDIDFAYTNHLERVEEDPYFTFTNEINAFNETIKDEKYFSLMEKQRKQDRKNRDNIRLNIENKKRVALEEEPYQSIDVFNEERKRKNKEKRQKKEREHVADEFVEEAGRILADFIYSRSLHDDTDYALIN